MCKITSLGIEYKTEFPPICKYMKMYTVLHTYMHKPWLNHISWATYMPLRKRAAMQWIAMPPHLLSLIFIEMKCDCEFVNCWFLNCEFLNCKLVNCDLVIWWIRIVILREKLSEIDLHENWVNWCEGHGWVSIYIYSCHLSW